MPNDAVRPAPIRNSQCSREELDFPHPSEQEFARILDFYGIKWQYEPVTYPLRWDETGQIQEAFTPDFYLVEQDLYVELTTLRQKLTRIKNRKLRRLRELYPGINIRLWNRKDFTRLLERFGLMGREEDLVGKQALESQDAQA